MWLIKLTNSFVKWSHLLTCPQFYFPVGSRAPSRTWTTAGGGWAGWGRRSSAPSRSPWSKSRPCFSHSCRLSLLENTKHHISADILVSDQTDCPFLVWVRHYSCVLNVEGSHIIQGAEHIMDYLLSTPLWNVLLASGLIPYLPRWIAGSSCFKGNKM